MSREMRAFVSLIVWLFSTTGADGAIATKPDSAVFVKGSSATLHCTGGGETPTTVQWSYQGYDKPFEKNSETPATDAACKASAAFVDGSGSPTACDLIVKDTVDKATYLYVCRDSDDDVARGIVMVIESPLSCGIENNKYSCTMANSAYKNTSEIAKPFISSRLIWKDDSGNIVGTKDSDFQNPGTVVTADIPDGVSRDSPHVCSAEFKIDNKDESTDAFGEYTATVGILPDGKLECKYPETAEHEQSAQDAAAEAAKQAGTNKTSNANLERDGVDAIAMLLSLMAAFLVY